MRLTIYISTVFVAILLLGFSKLSLPVTITGHLKKNLSDTSANINDVSVFVKGNNKVLAKTLTDNKGDFTITFTPNNEKSFDFYYTDLGIDTLLLSSVTTFESDTPEMTFYVPANYKINAFRKTICPKCKRTDKVYKIQYGDAAIMSMHISKSGDTTYSLIYKGVYQAFGINGLASYYCDRDKVRF